MGIRGTANSPIASRVDFVTVLQFRNPKCRGCCRYTTQSDAIIGVVNSEAILADVIRIYIYIYIYIYRERERERERERQRDRETQIERETEGHTETDRERDRGTERHR